MKPMAPKTRSDLVDALTDSVTGVVHSFRDMGLTEDDVERALKMVVFHVNSERGMTARGLCSKCERGLG